MQAHVSVCKENILEVLFRRKNDTYRNNFAVNGTSLKDHIRRVGRHIKIIFSRLIDHNIKILVLY